MCVVLRWTGTTDNTLGTGNHKEIDGSRMGSICRQVVEGERQSSGRRNVSKSKSRRGDEKEKQRDTADKRIEIRRGGASCTSERLHVCVSV